MEDLMTNPSYLLSVATAGVVIIATIIYYTKQRRECRATEMHDEALFKTPPPRDECPICLLPHPINKSEQYFQSCCGKIICGGCMYGVVEHDDRELCPFCRAPGATTIEGEWVERLRKRVGLMMLTQSPS